MSEEPEKKSNRGGAREGAGRKKSEKSLKNPQVQFGRHSIEDLNLIDNAAYAVGKNRSDFVWPVIMEFAKRTLKRECEAGTVVMKYTCQDCDREWRTEATFSEEESIVFGSSICCRSKDCKSENITCHVEMKE